jgi:hypothetical protein
VQLLRITIAIASLAMFAGCAGAPPPVTDPRARPADAAAAASPRPALEPARLELPERTRTLPSEKTAPEEHSGHPPPAEGPRKHRHEEKDVPPEDPSEPGHDADSDHDESGGREHPDDREKHPGGAS